jgi:glycosyltransferase involved in cell wall biosynthesis
MKILIANYRYFVSSGPERYLFNITDKLEREGQTVMPFSIHYDKNLESPYSKYFVEPIGGRSSVYFDEDPKTPSAIVKGLSRTFYSYEVRHAIERMVDETQPDVAYVLYYLRKLSPSLLVGLHKKKVPIVVRISDYGMFCPEHHMLRDGVPCTLCQHGNILNSVRHRCVKGSLAVSAIDAAATYFHRMRGYFDMIDQYVTTNDFMTEMMIEAGFPKQKIVCIPTFTNLEKFAPGPGPAGAEPYLLYVGRLDGPKGVHVLLDAMKILAARPGVTVPRLKLAGAGHTGSYVDGLHRTVAEAKLEDRIEFLGSQPAETIAELMRGALASLMPALWYENLPNSVVESLASGCPVISSDIGSLAYTITDDKDGLLFPPGDAGALADAIVRITTDDALRQRLAAGARHTAETKHNPDDHVAKLLRLFSGLIPAQQARLAEPAVVHS